MVRRGRQEDAPLTPAAIEARRIILADPDSFIQTNLLVPNFHGDLVAFKYKRGQQRAAELQRRASKQRRAFRGWFLKARQVGLTTQTVNRNFIKCLCAEGYRRALTVAHREDRAKEILGKVRDGTFRQLPKYLQFALAKDSEYAIGFADFDAKMWIVSGRTLSAIERARGDTIQDAHLTEWTRTGDPMGVLKEILIPCHYIAGNSVIIETTGHLIGGPAHDHWERSKRGETGFHAEFLRWQDEPASQGSVTDGIHWEEWDKKLLFERMREVAAYAPELLERGQQFNLTPGNIYWSYEMLKNACQGDWQLFLEDFPNSEDEAWQAKGDPYFDLHQVKFLLNHVDEIPCINYKISFNQLERGFKDFKSLQEVDKEELDEKAPYLRAWRGPGISANYLMAIKASEGTDMSEPASIFVINMDSGEMMAEFHGIVKPYQLARFANSLGRFYNNAKCAPILHQGCDLALLNEMHRYLHYSNWYRDRRFDDLIIKISDKMGWVRREGTDGLLLTTLSRVLEECTFGNMKLIRSKELLYEMQTFLHNHAVGRPEPQENCYDTRIFTLATAWFVSALETHGSVIAKLRSKRVVDDPDTELILPKMTVQESMQLIRENHGIVFPKNTQRGLY